MMKKSWSPTEAHERFTELLDAATNQGPQRIVTQSYEFELRVVRASGSPRGIRALGKGGPLPNDGQPEHDADD